MSGGGSGSRRDVTVQSLRYWRDRLLDLSRRNPLLYFSHSRGTKIRIADPGPTDLYQSLVLSEKTLTFPRPVDRSVEDAQWSASEVGTDPHGSVAERPGDLVVDYQSGSAKDVIMLQRKLRRLEANARASLEELGVNTLYVALGLLRWREPGSAAIARYP